MFKVIEQPNDFSNQIKKITKESGASSETKVARLDFWTKFIDRVVSTKSKLKTIKATTDHWHDFSIGSSKCHIVASLVNKDNLIRVEMWINDSKEQYDIFLTNKDEIETELDYSLT